MPRFLFSLGHQPHISLAEIHSVFSTEQYAGVALSLAHSQKETYAIVQTEKPLHLELLQKKLGGTTRIMEQLPEISRSPRDIAAYLSTKHPTGKITFSFSGEGGGSLAIEIKKYLKTMGHSVRYVEPKNAATTMYNGLVDSGTDLHYADKALWVTKTIQPFEDFTSRDYDRPSADDRSGMLPPKLARMMINLAEQKIDASLYDPFCGSGTLLVEALSLGYKKIIGSDLSPQAIDDAKKNTEWFCNKEHIPQSTKHIFVHDASQPNPEVKKESVDAIVTEPYLGAPLTGKEPAAFLQKQILELSTLYEKTFLHLKPILKKNGVVVFIIPSFFQRNEQVRIPFLDTAKRLGYTVLPFQKNESLLYRRPNQHVGREIWRFKKDS